MTEAQQELEAETLDDDELFAACARAGNLRFKLHEHQKGIYDKYRAWEKTRQNDESDPVPGAFPRVFCIAKSGRYGGSTLSLLIKVEDCIRNPGQMHRISSAFQKNINEIVHDVSRYVFEGLPDDVKPVYKGSQGPQGAAFYFPLQAGWTRQSVIRLIGLDLHPDGSRGTASDGDVITEAGFVKQLFYVVKNVIYRQYQGRPHASLILETSAPDMLDTDWESTFLPDAIARDAAAFATIDDNPLLTARERAAFIAAMGGRGNPDCEREYYNVIAVPPRSRIVPEFDEFKHVQTWERPANAHCYVSADPGQRDLFALLFAYWDFSRGALYIEDEWAADNALTEDVVTAIRAIEGRLWGTPLPGAIDRFAPRQARRAGDGPDVEVIDRWLPQVGAPPGMLTYYDGKWLRPNPYIRVSDIDLRLCADLSRTHNLPFEPIRKDSAEAMASAFRDAVSTGKVIVHPRCVRTRSTLLSARWNKHRTDWDRTKAHGHFDLLACAIYLWRLVDQYRHLNPNPPYRPVVAQNVEVMDSLPWQAGAKSPEVAALEVLMGGSSSRARPGQVRVRTHR